MPVEVRWYCDYCNASKQERKPGDEVPTGYYVSPLDTTPPLGWFETRSGEYACGECPQSKALRSQEGAEYLSNHRHGLPVEPPREDGDLVGDQERAAAAAIPPSHRATWPSIASPFAGHDPEGIAHGGGVHNDG